MTDPLADFERIQRVEHSPWIKALRDLDQQVHRFNGSGVLVGKNKATLAVVFAAIDLIDIRDEISAGVRDELGYPKEVNHGSQ